MMFFTEKRDFWTEERDFGPKTVICGSKNVIFGLKNVSHLNGWGYPTHLRRLFSFQPLGGVIMKTHSTFFAKSLTYQLLTVGY